MSRRGEMELSIARSVNRVLVEHWGGGVPVDPVRVARSAGIDVFETRLDADVTSAFERSADGSASIYLSAVDDVLRRRFACAVAVGASVYSGQRRLVHIGRRAETVEVRVEVDRFATGFAASLLMPEMHVKRFRRAGASEKDLARAFGVSAPAMVNRLKVLGLYRG